MEDIQTMIVEYAEKKVSGEMDLNAIKNHIRHHHDFSENEFKELISAIQDKEFQLLAEQKNPLARFLQSNLIALFFFLFALVAAVFSVYIIWNQSEEVSSLNQFLPWVILMGAILLIFKHGNNLRKK
jgi:hypothetical protein